VPLAHSESPPPPKNLINLDSPPTFPNRTRSGKELSATQQSGYLMLNITTTDNPQQPRQPTCAPAQVASHQSVSISTWNPAAESRPFSCDQCQWSFQRQNELTRHENTHKGEQPFLCHGCGKAFTRKDALRRHQVRTLLLSL
jgi:uncharacterized Zn-finger protein